MISGIAVTDAKKPRQKGVKTQDTRKSSATVLGAMDVDQDNALSTSRLSDREKPRPLIIPATSQDFQECHSMQLLADAAFLEGHHTTSSTDRSAKLHPENIRPIVKQQRSIAPPASGPIRGGISPGGGSHPSSSSSVPILHRSLSPGVGPAKSPRSTAHPYQLSSLPTVSGSALPSITSNMPSHSGASGTHPMRSSPISYPGQPVYVQVQESLTSGLKMSPRRRKAPAFPSSPRPVRTGAGYPEPPPSAVDYLNTPSILRVPPSPNPSMLRSPLSPSVPIGFSAAMSHVRAGPSGLASTVGGSLPDPRAMARSTARLQGIPQAYVLKSLHNLAGQFWNKPATADCRILIPVRHDGQTTPSPTTSVVMAAQSMAPVAQAASPSMSNASPVVNSAGTFGGGPRRVWEGQASAGGEAKELQTADSGMGAKILTFPMHSDYLTTQSALFKHLFSMSIPPVTGSSFPLSNPLSPTTPETPYTQRIKSPLAPSPGEPAPLTPSPLERAKTSCRILPTPPGVPMTIWVPVPDPSSFGVLPHWLYWGDVSALEGALVKGHVTWQGIVKNIEYLGLDDSIKRVMGTWWRRWVKVSAGRVNEQGVAVGAGGGRTTAGTNGEASASVGLGAGKRTNGAQSDDISESGDTEGTWESEDPGVDGDVEDIEGSSKGKGRQRDVDRMDEDMDGDEDGVTGLLKAL